jgi:acyl-CoA thioesterase-2
VSDRAAEQQAAVDELLGLLEHERRDDAWVGTTPDWGPVVLFGGIVLALVVGAACREAPPGSRLHSMHAHFLRPVLGGGGEVAVRSEVVKPGRTFNLHRVTASQDDKVAVTMMCSFTSDTDGYVYDLSGIPAGVPLPDDLPEAEPHEWGVGPWDERWVGPSPVRTDGTREATHRHWFRLARDLGDDDRIHTALLGYATDWTGIGGRPLHLEGDTTGMISLDHAAWFHRPARADQWLLQDVQSLVNAGGRGTLRGVIRDVDGRIVASMAQEMLLRPIET